MMSGVKWTHLPNLPKPLNIVTSNDCSMRILELIVVIFAMLIPFIAMKSEDLTTYLFWIAVVAIYLVYIAVRRWEIE